jgi:hypothetical protein
MSKTIAAQKIKYFPLIIMYGDILSRSAALRGRNKMAFYCTYRIPGPLALELDGVSPDVEVAEVAPGVGQQQDGARGDPLTYHLQHQVPI